MLHKILVNVFSVFTTAHFITIYIFTKLGIAEKMYTSYGLAYQMPRGYLLLLNFSPIILIVAILIIGYLIWYNIFFTKNKRLEDPKLYKKVSIYTYFSLAALFLIVMFLFVQWFLRPIIEMYEASFLFEANGM